MNPLTEQIKERIESLSKRADCFDDPNREYAYRSALSDVQELLPSIIQEVVEETRKDTVLLLHKRLSETSDWNKAISLFTDDLASLKETNE